MGILFVFIKMVGALRFFAVHNQTMPFVDMWLAQRFGSSCPGQTLSIGFLVIGLWRVLTIIHPRTPGFSGWFGVLGGLWVVCVWIFWWLDMAANPLEMASTNY